VDERDWLAARFQAHRPRLRAVAYRMPGSTSEADDAVQEAWIRLSRANAGAIDNLEAWLASAVGGWRPTCAAPASRGASSHRRRTCRTRSWTAPTASTPSTRRWWPPPGSAWSVWPVLVNGAAGWVALGGGDAFASPRSRCRAGVSRGWTSSWTARARRAWASPPFDAHHNQTQARQAHRRPHARRARGPRDQLQAAIAAVHAQAQAAARTDWSGSPRCTSSCSIRRPHRWWRSTGRSPSPWPRAHRGDRDGHIIDPFGHGWTIATHVEDVAPQELARRMAGL
jgi:hypothetical protein